jgi:hypothetical protein
MTFNDPLSALYPHTHVALAGTEVLSQAPLTANRPFESLSLRQRPSFSPDVSGRRGGVTRPDLRRFAGR